MVRVAGLVGCSVPIFRMFAGYDIDEACRYLTIRTISTN